jgi:hypothetical protein
MSGSDRFKNARWIVMTLLLGAGGLAFAAETKDAADVKKDKPYPLSACIVSDEKLGEMGEPTVIQHKGREIKFCCADCVKSFNDDPQKYIAKLDKAAKASATQPASQPSTRKSDEGHKHDHKH